MISQYDKDMCCLYIAEGMSYICNKKGTKSFPEYLNHWPIGSS